eukprot:scaffold23424_cov75-Phaeocystis_antarctica.AAC.6
MASIAQPFLHASWTIQAAVPCPLLGGQTGTILSSTAGCKTSAQAVKAEPPGCETRANLAICVYAAV